MRVFDVSLIILRFLLRIIELTNIYGGAIWNRRSIYAFEWALQEEMEKMGETRPGASPVTKAMEAGSATWSSAGGPFAFTR